MSQWGRRHKRTVGMSMKGIEEIKGFWVFFLFFCFIILIIIVVVMGKGEGKMYRFTLLDLIHTSSGEAVTPDDSLPQFFRNRMFHRSHGADRNTPKHTNHTKMQHSLQFPLMCFTVSSGHFCMCWVLFQSGSTMAAAVAHCYTVACCNDRRLKQILNTNE